jgi:hypothetical protein
VGQVVYDPVSCRLGEDGSCLCSMNDNAEYNVLGMSSFVCAQKLNLTRAKLGSQYGPSLNLSRVRGA